MQFNGSTATLWGAAALRVLGRMWRVDRRRTAYCAAGAMVAALSNLTLFVSVGALIHSLGSGTARSETWFWFGVFCCAPVMIISQHLVVQMRAPVLTRKVLVDAHGLIAGSLLAGMGDRPVIERAAVLARDWRVRHGLDRVWELMAARLTAILSAGLLIQWRWWVPILLLPIFARFSIDYESWLSEAADDGARGQTRSEEMVGYLGHVMVSPAFAKDIRLFGLAEWLRQQFSQTAALVLARSDSRSRPAYRRVVRTGAAMTVCTGATFALLGHDCFTGGISTSIAVTSALAIAGLQGFLPAGDLQSTVNKAADLSRGVDLDPRLAATNVIEASRHPADASIVLRDVSFTYPGASAPTIANLNLSVTSGELIAIVGANGSGKSTLVKLLTGAVSPDRGQIAVCGLSPEQAADHRLVAAVLQDPVHYPLSLLENVTLAFGSDKRPSVEQERRIGILPADYPTVLSSAYRGGVDLSGGEWQRVAFARAMIAVAAGAPVLIMDEPSAALDALAERNFNQTTMPSLDGVTKVLISHRLSSVRHADRIVVLSRMGGQILESGRHDELMAVDGTYAKLFRMQAAHYSSSVDYEVGEA